MLSKIVLSVLAALLLVQLASATSSSYCPEPENSDLRVYENNVIANAAEFGRTEKEYIIPPSQYAVNCIIVTGYGGFSSPAISSVGYLEDGSIKVKLVSGIQEGFYVLIEAYSKRP